MNRQTASVVVIGAGQAGLSVAYYLQKLGLKPGTDLIIVDRGPSTGGAWQHRWESLRLGSAHRVHDLPGMKALGVSFDTADRSLPAREVVEDYYRRYEQFYDLRVQRPVTVGAVFDRGADLVVQTSAGEITALALVNATGTWGAPFVPYYPGAWQFEGRQVHTSSYISAEEFRGKNVLVVGGGTSAIGFLLELEGVAAKMFWTSRRPIDYRDHGSLDLEDAINAVAEQDAAARAGKALPSIVSGTGVAKTRRIAAGIERGVLVARPLFERLTEDSVVWPDGSSDRIDAIIWATGFRPDIRHLSPLRLHEKAGGVVVTTGAAERDPRVFFAGYGPTASTIGANRAGRLLARQVFTALGGRRASSEPEPILAASAPLGDPMGASAAPSVTTSTDSVSILSRFFADD
ncbi:NAD(P)-binding domain-containing protein [Amnibacterium flavum]|uniref:Pyridine nucleotide-disulfide oxidoreductase n=1 Tax=Amnibacterium flavum TaxID=2173173 RepID=A0A2V1HSL3_9MICO|nr:NAD(P)-binding domain-containing protein [Amnibacterium flavum]PVZ95321.1 pyridine nucleotide-disulfide oxidoreductase [Amnibacterium flavum]